MTRTNLKYCLELKLSIRTLKKLCTEHERSDPLTQLQSLASYRKNLEELETKQHLYRLAKKFGFIWW